VGGDAHRVGGGGGKSDIDGVGHDRPRRSVDLGKFHPFDIEALVFGKLHLLHYRAEPQAKTAGPIADFYFLRERLAGNGNRHGQKKCRNDRFVYLHFASSSKFYHVGPSAAKPQPKTLWWQRAYLAGAL